MRPNHTVSIVERFLTRHRNKKLRQYSTLRAHFNVAYRYRNIEPDGRKIVPRIKQVMVLIYSGLHPFSSNNRENFVFLRFQLDVDDYNWRFESA